MKSRHSPGHYFTAHCLHCTYFSVLTPFVSNPREAKVFPTLQTIFGEKKCVVRGLNTSYHFCRENVPGIEIFHSVLFITIVAFGIQFPWIWKLVFSLQSIVGLFKEKHTFVFVITLFPETTDSVFVYNWQNKPWKHISYAFRFLVSDNIEGKNYIQQNWKNTE